MDSIKNGLGNLYRVPLALVLQAAMAKAAEALPNRPKIWTADGTLL
jgi:hypothetical protein